MKLCLFDPGIEDRQGTPSGNLGNLIIQQAVNRELEQLFHGWNIVRVSTFQSPDPGLRRELRSCDVVLVGGTNILTSEANRYRQWVISLRHVWGIRRSILLGAGWWKYQDKPNLYTRLFYKLLLADGGWHSVRDGYTAQMLGRIGYRNILNTACVTMWPLADRKAEDYPNRKGKDVLLMLTDYEPDPQGDVRLINLLRRHYRIVHVWPQGKFDLEYLHDLGTPLSIMERSFSALNSLLRSDEDFDYVGTRLHGGIHCLNHGRRSLIIEVDNRAREIALDTGLRTARRNDFEAIEHWILNPEPFRITLPAENIGRWRQQFQRSCQES